MSRSTCARSVYLHPDGNNYVMQTADGAWVQWPAQRDGWARRAPCDAELIARCVRLDDELGRLALRLSGADA